MKPAYEPHSKLDLSFTRVVDVPRALVWRAWTEPKLLMPWFCPLPWKTIDCEIDLRPGGIFRTTMQSPEGREFPNIGCYLDVVPNKKLVWTNALLPGYRPSYVPEKCGTDDIGFMFTAMIELADQGQGTRYTATVIHADEAGCKKHAEMGFEGGWGTALDQLVAMIQRGVTDDSEREVVLQREVPFARELVWMAMTVPEHQNRWWGPDGFRNEGVTMDFRVGGAWTFDMIGPDGGRYPNHSVFKEITPPSRLVFDHGDGQRIWFESSIVLQETATGTLITLRHVFPSKESRDEVVEKFGAIEGGNQHLAKLEAYLRDHSQK